MDPLEFVRNEQRGVPSIPRAGFVTGKPEVGLFIFTVSELACTIHHMFQVFGSRSVGALDRTVDCSKATCA
ncbi:hypothetical protein [Nocardia brasiliensis]|uniref:hypothetical protein n=1 Tax=Nocardia brasiliensis TaxID=37326 RepID=UPI0024554CAA|nr:hypothetical protein [Nocardia brasiliensis]